MEDQNVPNVPTLKRMHLETLLSNLVECGQQKQEEQGSCQNFSFFLRSYVATPSDPYTMTEKAKVRPIHLHYPFVTCNSHLKKL